EQRRDGSQARVRGGPEPRHRSARARGRAARPDASARRGGGRARARLRLRGWPRGLRPRAQGGGRAVAGRGHARGRDHRGVGAPPGGRVVSDVLAAIISLGFVGQVLRIAVPYALAAMGGAVTERAGVIDLALEGKLLFGAFTAAAVGHATGSALLGLAGGIAAGMIVAAVQIGFALGLGANQVIVGFALNLVGAAGTRFLLQLVYGEGANSPPCPAYGSAVLGNPIVWLTVLAAI